MHYIVMDLEWNQPLSHLSIPFQREGARLMFDLIQIGAVKLDRERRMTGSFSQVISPGCYRKMHPRIKRITGISQDDLAGEPGFVEAYERFLSWCGDDFVLMTWGCDDISVFQQNINFYFKTEQALPPVYDLQRLYGALEGGGKNRTGLQSALSRHAIVSSPEHPFHSAVDDAYYTALVFQRLPDADAIFAHPLKARELLPAKTRKDGKADDLRFSTIAQAMASKPARQPNCPVCGKSLALSEGYVPLRDQTWRALAECPDHGLVFVDLMLEYNAKKQPFVRRRAVVSDQQSKAYIQTKHLQWADKLKRNKAEVESA